MADNYGRGMHPDRVGYFIMLGTGVFIFGSFGSMFIMFVALLLGFSPFAR